MRQTAAAVCLAVLAAASASAADMPSDEAGDADALSLADKAPSEKAAAQSWRVFGEGVLTRSGFRNPPSSQNEGRASIDLRFDSTVAPTLRAVLSDRLDLGYRGEGVLPRTDNVNTVREAYLSWHLTPDAITDVGRINLRYGAAFGYNPTDFFKADALRSIVSIDPVSLRENRQGTVVVQAQKLWTGSSLTAAYSPRLGDSPNMSTFSLDFGATNPRNRWLLVGSHKFTEELNPQIVLYGGEQTPTQVGMNLSGLVNTSTVAYLEVAAGRGMNLIDEAVASPASEHMQQRAAAGLTYTTSFNLSLTAEYEYNSAAPTRGQWDTFRGGGPGNASAFLATAQMQQDLPSRDALFLYGFWKDVAIRSLDLSAFVRWDSQTHSREQWLETRYHWSKTEVALRWQQYSGAFTSVYGSVPQSRQLDLLLRLFL